MIVKILVFYAKRKTQWDICPCRNCTIHHQYNKKRPIKNHQSKKLKKEYPSLNIRYKPETIKIDRKENVSIIKYVVSFKIS